MKTLTEAAKKVVSAAIELISDPEKWTRGTCARDKDNYSIDAYAEEACKWCAFGAILKKCSDLNEDMVIAYSLTDIFFHKFGETIGPINDKEGREIVIEKLQELINGDELPVNP